MCRLLWWCSSSAPSPRANSVRATFDPHHPACCCLGPLTNSWEDQAFNEMRREPKAALCVQLSLTEDCLWQSVGQRVLSTAVRTPVPVRSRPNPEGWGVQCAGTLQEVSKTVMGFFRLALFVLVRMGKPVSEWGSGRAQTVAGQSCSCPEAAPFLLHLLPLRVFQ